MELVKIGWYLEWCGAKKLTDLYVHVTGVFGTVIFELGSTTSLLTNQNPKINTNKNNTTQLRTAIVTTTRTTKHKNTQIQKVNWRENNNKIINHTLVF